MGTTGLVNVERNDVPDHEGGQTDDRDHSDRTDADEHGDGRGHESDVEPDPGSLPQHLAGLDPPWGGRARADGEEHEERDRDGDPIEERAADRDLASGEGFDEQRIHRSEDDREAEQRHQQAVGQDEALSRYERVEPGGRRHGARSHGEQRERSEQDDAEKDQQRRADGRQAEGMHGCDYTRSGSGTSRRSSKRT